MPDNKTVQNDLWNLISTFKGRVGYYDSFSSITHLFFLKYLVSYSDRFDNLTINSYKALTNFKRKLDTAKNGGEPLLISDFSDLFYTLDSEKLLSDMKLVDSLRKYDELFRNVDSQRALLRALEDINFESDNDFIGNFFELLVQECSRDARMTGESVSSKSLRDLSAALLNVSAEDDFLNCFSGYSSITLNIKDYKRYTGYEINKSTFMVSKMLLIMRGFKNTYLYNEDFLMSNVHESADKVFSDGPISMKYDNPVVQRELNVNTKDGDLLILYKVLDSIKVGGLGVIAVPGRVLFSDSNSYKDMRNKYVVNGLKGVISLPPLWSGTFVPTNLLVVEKGYKGNITFIDAKDLGINNRNNVNLREEDIKQIVDAFNQQTIIDNFSISVDRDKVVEKSNWQPNTYINYVSENEYRDIKEIDSELNSLYKELMDNIK